MNVTIQGALITSAASLLSAIIPIIWERLSKNDKSPKVSKRLVTALLIMIVALSSFLGMRHYLLTIPSVADVEKLNQSIIALQTTLDEKEKEVGALADENEDLSNSNEQLKKENQELNEKLNPSITSLSSVLYKNEVNFEVSDSPIKDSLGNTYKGGSMLLTAFSTSDYGKADFYLQGKYSTLKNVTFAISDSTGGSDYSGYEGYVSLYALVDGKTIELATSAPLNTMSEKYVFEDINVSGVEWLEIRFSTPETYWNRFTGIVADAELN